MIAKARMNDLWSASGYWRYSGDWIEYFRENKDALMTLPWDAEDALTAQEKKILSRSIAIFQLGESSEGDHFIAAGQSYVDRSADTHYTEALQMFINEEHRHSRDLGRFMRAHDIPFLTKQWTDNVFRCIRKIAGLEICISVLVTAELVAKTYYTALHDATQSPVLRALCCQISRDEIQHVYFQAGVLGRMRQGRSLWQLLLGEVLHRGLMMGTLVVVWIDHGNVYRAGGYSFLRYARETWAELRDCLRISRTWAVLGGDARHMVGVVQAH